MSKVTAGTPEDCVRSRDELAIGDADATYERAGGNAGCGLTMRFISAFVGLILIAFSFKDVFEVVLLPRRVAHRTGFAQIFLRWSWMLWRRHGARIADAERREELLSIFGPLTIVFLLAAWAVGLIVGYGCLEWALEPNAEGFTSWIERLYMSGVTFFTLGYGDVVPKGDVTRLVTVVEAGSGIGFIAAVIGYIPVLYQLFSRREAHVLQLDARAGSPPTAAELLRRHSGARGLQHLDGYLRDWEVWASELLESHLSYPILAFYRSQHPNQSWLGALTAIMDCCALIISGVHDLHPLQARMTFTTARLVMVELAYSLGAEPSPFTGGVRLDDEAYATLDAALRESDLGWNSGEEARDSLKAFRATYEPLLDGLSKYLLLPLPSFLPNAADTDNYERGHRGLIFGRLIEDPSRSDVIGADMTSTGGRWRRLRRRLREL